MAQPHSVGSKRPLSVVSSVRLVSYEQVYRLIVPAAEILVLIVLNEEDTVALATNFGENGGRGCLVGNEVEPLLFCQPVNRRGILDVVTNELVRYIARVNSLYHAAPTKLEGDACRYRWYQWWWCKAKSIGNVEVVQDIRVTDDH
jgi:hypothetical protein